MGNIIIPVIIFLIAGLGVLGLVLLERRPAREWSEQIRTIRDQAPVVPLNDVDVIPEDVHLSDLFTTDSTPVYTGTQRIQGLVSAVEKTFEVAEHSTQAMRVKVKTKG